MSNSIEVIQERISLADSILAKLSDLTRLQRPRSNSGVISIDCTVRYNTVLVKQIIGDLSKWQFVTTELLIKQFGEDSRFTKRFEASIVEHKKGRDYKAELTREIEAGITALNSIIESIQLSGNLSIKNTSEVNTKDPMVFISHSSKDIEFVEALVELLEGIGLTPKTLFCSSIQGYWLGLSQNIFEALRSLFLERSLYVIFVQSSNFYQSPVSLNEMGAAWALKADYCSILTSEMDYSEMTAVVNSHEIAIKVNTEDAPARLTEMKDTILKFLGKDDISPVVWKRKLDKFLKSVTAAHVIDSTSSQPST